MVPAAAASSSGRSRPELAAELGQQVAAVVAMATVAVGTAAAGAAVPAEAALVEG